MWTLHYTEVRFVSFLSSGFITAIVVNSPERKLEKCTSVHCIIDYNITNPFLVRTVFEWQLHVESVISWLWIYIKGFSISGYNILDTEDLGQQTYNLLKQEMQNVVHKTQMQAVHLFARRTLHLYDQRDYPKSYI